MPQQSAGLLGKPNLKPEVDGRTRSSLKEFIMQLALDAASRYSRLYEAIKNMIEICEEQQPEVLQMKMHIGSQRWLEQFCSIRIAGPRRSGHTTAILSLVKEKYKRALVLTQNMQMAKTIETELKRLDLSDKAVVSSVNSENPLRGIEPFEAVIVDCSSMLTDEEIERVYDIATPHSENRRLDGKNFVIIFLQ